MERPIPSGEALLILAALVSLQLAQGRTADQLELIAAFFEVLGDNLSLIAARRSLPESNQTPGTRPDT
ncbi:MAG: hypothetical protein HFF30_05340 [Flavonifractor sp.]|nr:hypothetical protein [Flavonifractor sp.]